MEMASPDSSGIEWTAGKRLPKIPKDSLLN